MKEIIEKKFTELLTTGQKLTNSIPCDKYDDPGHWVEVKHIAEYHQWLTSVANLVKLIAPANSIFMAECNRLMNDERFTIGIPARVVQQMYGVLNSALEEWKAGLLRKIEYIVVAETFDDFLDHATQFHKGNKKIESSVLASVVLEDTVKKIANRNDIDPRGLSLESLINELIKKNLFIERILLTDELKNNCPDMFKNVTNLFKKAKLEVITHKDFKEKVRLCKGVIRTGEFTAYSNAILVTGADPERWATN